MLVLRGKALQLLKNISEEDQKDYAIVKVLELRFGDHHLKQIYQSQLKTRMKKSNETTKKFATEVERLANLGYPEYPLEYREQMGTGSFIDGLTDVELKQTLRRARLQTIRDALVQALEYEATKDDNGTEQVRQIRVEDNSGDGIKNLKKMINS